MVQVSMFPVNLTNSFQNYEETKKVHAMKLQDLFPNSRSYVGVKFHPVGAVLRQDITQILQ